MARFVNDTDQTLRSFDLGRDIGPREEFDWPDFDPETHGTGIPGCRRLDKPRKPRPSSDTGSNEDPNPAGGNPAAGQPATGDAAGASKENPQ